MIVGDRKGKSLRKTGKNWKTVPGESGPDSGSRKWQKFFYQAGRFSADFTQILATLPQR
ncbi:hypothetical protein [Rhizobium sp. SL86]|uniref:hypothetical protein n=1 Tax=Rhizobium sp. SL86 TaxID=2995148 RepID=UPI002275786D|nr:hypothetical protein [Rhizobium sp. SL86]MCY1664982.1 hypothetical protein [Rhizobium sp. SL86]